MKIDETIIWATLVTYCLFSLIYYLWTTDFQDKSLFLTLSIVLILSSIGSYLNYERFYNKYLNQNGS